MKSVNPKVSVIIPVYNREESVGYAIESVLGQTYSDYEIIVIDDGSTDGTDQVLRAFGERAQVLSQTNRGPYAARNLGLKHASGEYIAFLDSDDTWLPQRLEKQVPLLDTNHQIGLVFGNGRMIYQGENRPARTFFQYFGAPSRGRVFSQLLYRNFIPQSSVLARRRCFEECGPFLELPLAADHHKWLQIALRYEVAFTDDVVITYKVHSGNISRDLVTRYRSFLKAVHHLCAVEEDPRVSAMLRRRVLEIEYKIALIHLYEGFSKSLGTVLRPFDGTNIATRSLICARVAAQEVGAAGRKLAWELSHTIHSKRPH